MQEQLPAVDYLPEDVLNSRLGAAMAPFQDAPGSPLTHMILRNSILMLLELPEHVASVQLVYELLTDAQFRNDAVKRLGETTPQYWSEGWDSLWRKDIDPLLSVTQQRVAKRNSILAFWSKEWGDVHSGAKTQAVKILEMMGAG